MTSPQDRLDEGLRSYRRELLSLAPSAELDARIARAIERECGAGARTASRPGRELRINRALAAALCACAIALGWLIGRSSNELASRQEEPSLARSTGPLESGALIDLPAATPLEAASYSPWPVEAAVVRVRGRLAAPADDRVAGERQFWVDVRLAGDGSMRIVRVVPIEDEEISR